MRKSILFSLMLALFIFSSGFEAEAQKKKKKKKGQPTTVAKRPTKGKTIKAITSKSIAMEGLFTMYKDTTNGKMHFLVKEAQLGKEFIYFSYSENGVKASGHIKGNFRGSKVFRIRKYYNQLEFEVLNNSHYFDSSLAISKSKSTNISNAIVASEKILNKDTKKGNYLISADALFLSEKLQQIKPAARPGARGFSLGRLSKLKTKFHNVKSYPENMDIIVDYVYDNPSPRGSGSGITDARSVTITYQHSIIAMPDNDFKPRFDDPRVGYFTTSTNDMTTKEAVNYRDYVHRWNLKKKNPELALSEPVEPITYWIENTTPLEYRETVKKAILTWNLAFEKIGFKNAFQAKIQPDDADWDAGDIRYNVIRWTSSPSPRFGGYGPSFVNPRTGEILGADIMIEYVFLTNRIKYTKLYQTDGMSMDVETEGEQDHSSCQVANHLQVQNQLGAQYLNAAGIAKPGQEDFIKQSIYYLILHEMGHTLGLNHNMKATQLHSPADLLNEELTQKVGLIGSVMDYPAINLHPEIGKKVQYFTNKPGPYDDWAIEFAYSETPEGSTAAQEKARLEKILSKSGNPKLLFGNDADDMRTPGMNGIDPRVMIGDMSNDAILFASQRVQLVQNLMKGLKSNYIDSTKSYHELRGAFNILSGEYMTQTGVISRYIGGVYVDRSFDGTTTNKPYTAVSLADQKRAMKALSDLVFAPNAMEIPGDLASYLQPQRRGFGFFFKPEDPKLHNRVMGLQMNVLRHILSRNVLLRLSDSRAYGNEYTTGMLFRDLNAAIFNADIRGNVNTHRQNIQIQYVDILAGIAGLSGRSPYDNIAKAKAYNALLNIEKSVKSGMSGGDIDSREHKKYLASSIKNYLDKK